MFLLDANVFIQASRLYYAPDIAPTFWEWLREQHEKGNIASIARIRDEIDDGKGPGHLKDWAASLPTSFWIRPDAHTPDAMARLSAWTMHRDRPYMQAARAAFFNAADYYLVAQALGLGHEVVTFEQPRPEAKKRVLIPDACKALGVPYREAFGLYRQLGLRFN